MSTCSTPCTLDLPLGEQFGIVVTYRGFPSEPLLVNTGNISPEDGDYLRDNPISVGWDDPDAVRSETKKCEASLKAYSQGMNAGAEPCYRVPPIMPSVAHQSGYCRMIFDVGIDGRPINIRPKVCTEIYFAAHAMHAVQNWRYFPEYKDGKAIIRRDLSVKVTFKLDDEVGNPVPSRVLLDNEKLDWMGAAKNWYDDE